MNHCGRPLKIQNKSNKCKVRVRPALLEPGYYRRMHHYFPEIKPEVLVFVGLLFFVRNYFFCTKAMPHAPLLSRRSSPRCFFFSFLFALFFLSPHAPVLLTRDKTRGFFSCFFCFILSPHAPLLLSCYKTRGAFFLTFFCICFVFSIAACTSTTYPR